MAASEKAKVHGVLSAALEIASPEDLPDPPYHLGGPRPEAPMIDLLEIGLWCCQQIQHLVEAELASHYQQILETVEPVLEQPRSQNEREVCRALVLPGETYPPEGIHAVVRNLRSACSQVIDGTNALVPNVSAISYRSAMLLDDAGEGQAVRALLVGIDERLMLHECHAFARRASKDPALRVERVLWRASDAKGKIGQIVCRMPSGDFGLVAKLKRRWRWFQGEKDAVLSNLPKEDADLAHRGLQQMGL